jgi:hypothetical protein
VTCRHSDRADANGKSSYSAISYSRMLSRASLRLRPRVLDYHQDVLQIAHTSVSIREIWLIQSSLMRQVETETSPPSCASSDIPHSE